MLIGSNLVGTILIIRFGEGKDRPHLYHLPYMALLVVLFTSCFLLRVGAYAFPQGNISTSADAQLQTALKDAMPQSEQRWDNTIAILPETDNAQLYYDLPLYLTTNCCLDSYLQSHIEESSMQSKYLSLPADHDLNESARMHYSVVYEGYGHIIYCTR